MVKFVWIGVWLSLLTTALSQRRWKPPAKWQFTRQERLRRYQNNLEKLNTEKQAELEKLKEKADENLALILRESLRPVQVGDPIHGPNPLRSLTFSDLDSDNNASSDSTPLGQITRLFGVVKMLMKEEMTKNKNTLETIINAGERVQQSKTEDSQEESWSRSFTSNGPPRSNLRSAMGMTDFSGIWNYGCWCSFGENIYDGRGEPVDTIDEACRALTLGMRCIIRDTAEMFYSCDPVNTHYNTPVHRPGESLSNSLIQCSRSNTRSDCKLWTCSVETEFAKSLVDFFFDLVPLQDKYLRENFDYKNECRSKEEILKDQQRVIKEPIFGPGDEKKPIGSWNSDIPSSNQNEKEIISDDSYAQHACCGQYPDRKMYVKNVMGCCPNNTGSNLFHLSTAECCSDGTIRDIGMCFNLADF